LAIEAVSAHPLIPAADLDRKKAPESCHLGPIGFQFAVEDHRAGWAINMSSTTKTQSGWRQKIVSEIVEYWIAFLYLALLLGSIYLVRWWAG
jgi:hypothetical protein